MEGLPHASRPGRLPGRGRVPGLERRVAAQRQTGARCPTPRAQPRCKPFIHSRPDGTNHRVTQRDARTPAPGVTPKGCPQVPHCSACQPRDVPRRRPSLVPSTDWRNGSASDSSPEGYAFESRIGH